MNSRGRVLAAIRHEVPDHVPVDLGGMRSTDIMAMAYARLVGLTVNRCVRDHSLDSMRFVPDTALSS